MLKLLRYIITTIATLIILLIIGALLLVTLVNPNNFKGKISEYFQQQTGRTINIAGNIHWTFYPWLGIKVNDVTIGNAATFEKTPFAKIGEADARIQLIPLFSGKVEAGKIIIKSLDLYLAKNSSGITNWSDIGKQKSTATTQLTGTTKAPEKEKQAQEMIIAISGIDISNSNIYWNNEQNGQTAQITKLQLSTSKIHLNRPVAINTSFNLQTTKPNYSGSLHFSGKVTADLDAMLYQLDKLNFSGVLNMPQSKNAINFALASDLTVDLKKQDLDAKNLSAEVNGLNLSGEINGSNIIDSPTFSGNVVVAKFNPRNLISGLGISLQNKNAMQSLAAKLTFQATPKVIKIPNLYLAFDDCVLTGNISTINLDNKIINFNLAMNKFDVTRYKTLPAAGKPASATAASSGAPATSATAWAANGNLKIGTLNLGQVALSNAAIKVSTSKGIMNINPITAGMLGGSINANVSINQTKATPSFSGNLTYTNFPVETVIKHFANSDKVTGTGNFNISFSAYGTEPTTIVKGLNGKGKLTISNGVIKGIDIRYTLRKMHALLKHDQTTRNDTGQTAFGTLAGTFNITNGVLYNNDLKLDANDFQVTGQGKLDLVNQRIDYTLNAANVNYTDVNGKKSASVEPIFIPIKVTGSFSSPKAYPDFQYVIKRFATQVIQQTAKQAVQSIVGGKVPLKDVGKNLGQTINKSFGIKIFK